MYLLSSNGVVLRVNVPLQRRQSFNTLPTNLCILLLIYYIDQRPLYLTAPTDFFFFLFSFFFETQAVTCDVRNFGMSIYGGFWVKNDNCVLLSSPPFSLR